MDLSISSAFAEARTTCATDCAAFALCSSAAFCRSGPLHSPEAAAGSLKGTEPLSGRNPSSPTCLQSASSKLAGRRSALVDSGKFMAKRLPAGPEASQLPAPLSHSLRQCVFRASISQGSLATSQKHASRFLRRVGDAHGWKSSALFRPFGLNFRTDLR